MAQTVAATMEAVKGAVVAALPELHAYPFPPKSAQPPFMFVNPTSVEYDLTYGRSFDTIELEVYVAVAAQVDRASWDQITFYADGENVKAAIEALGHGYRVESVTFGEVQLSAGVYMGAVFTVSAKV